jgi:ABC-type branched-subunit amino acid transport system ATPase component
MNPTLDLPGITCEFGEITGLLGRNGTGKSRLMKAGFATQPDLSYLPQVNFIPGQLTLKGIFHGFVMSATSFSMLDEPFTHLMPIQVEKIIEVMLEQKGEKGILITDHHYNYITRIADKIYVLANGRPCLVDTLSRIEQLGYATSGGPFPKAQ